MMTLDHVGDQEAMVHAQLGQQPLALTTETSLQPRQGTRSYLSAQPPALAFWTGIEGVTGSRGFKKSVRPSQSCKVYVSKPESSLSFRSP